MVTSLNTITSKEELGTLSNDDIDHFNPDHITQKIPLVMPVNPNTGLNTIAYHAEAVFPVRKVLIEKAIPHFPELTNLNVK